MGLKVKIMESLTFIQSPSINTETNALQSCRNAKVRPDLLMTGERLPVAYGKEEQPSPFVYLLIPYPWLESAGGTC